MERKERVSVVSLGTESVSEVYLCSVLSRAARTGEKQLRWSSGRYRVLPSLSLQLSKVDPTFYSKLLVVKSLMALGDLHGQRSSGTCREGTKRSCRIALSRDPGRCCRVTRGPVPQKPILARKEQHLSSAPSLPNGSVAGPGAINGCGNVSMRIIAQTLITLVTELACLRAGHKMCGRKEAVGGCASSGTGGYARSCSRRSGSQVVEIVTGSK